MPVYLLASVLLKWLVRQAVDDVFRCLVPGSVTKVTLLRDLRWMAVHAGVSTLVAFKGPAIGLAVGAASQEANIPLVDFPAAN